VPSTLTNVAVFDVSRLPRGLLATYGGGGTPTTRLGRRLRRRVAPRDSGGLQGVRLRPADQLLGRTSEDALLQACPVGTPSPRRLRRDGQSVGVENERALPWSYKRLRFHANPASARLATASCLGRYAGAPCGRARTTAMADQSRRASISGSDSACSSAAGAPRTRTRALASGRKHARERDAVSSPVPWMPAGPAPCFGEQEVCGDEQDNEACFCFREGVTASAPRASALAPKCWTCRLFSSDR
jgi:hypothetical protein